MTKNLRTFHDPAFGFWKRRPAVHGRTIVPYHQVIDTPFMRPDELRLHHVRAQRLKQLVAFLFL